MARSNWVGAPDFFNLDQACRTIVAAFGPHVYQVGSSLERRDFRDVDVRVILPDEEYDKLFPGKFKAQHMNALWSLLSSAVSMYLSQHSGLPVDFQIQRQSWANEEFDGPRNALGLFYEPTKPKDDDV